MESDKPIAAVGHRSHVADRQRRRIGSENRLGLADIVEPFVDALLDIHVFDHGFANQIAVGEILEFRGRADIAEHFLFVGLVGFALFDRFVE